MWESLRPAIATVSRTSGPNTVVTGVSPGVATIRANTASYHATAYVLVAPPVGSSNITRLAASSYRDMSIGWPIGYRANQQRPSFNRITPEGYFGNLRDGGRRHLGMDFGRTTTNVIMDAPVLSVTSGRVIFTQNHTTANNMGNVVAIRSDIRDSSTGNNLIFIYMHMRDNPNFADDAPITRGQIIGNVGNTGVASSSPNGHLHLEVSNYSVWQDPITVAWNIRARNRINPIYFYHAGSLVQGGWGPGEATTARIVIWNEVFS